MSQTIILQNKWEQKHSTKRLSENMILPGIEPGTPDYMLGALTHSAIESSTLTHSSRESTAVLFLASSTQLSSSSFITKFTSKRGFTFFRLLKVIKRERIQIV